MALALDPWLPTDFPVSYQTAWMCRLICVFDGRRFNTVGSAGVPVYIEHCTVGTCYVPLDVIKRRVNAFSGVGVLTDFTIVQIIM